MEEFCLAQVALREKKGELNREIAEYCKTMKLHMEYVDKCMQAGGVDICHHDDVDGKIYFCTKYSTKQVVPVTPESIKECFTRIESDMSFHDYMNNILTATNRPPSKNGVDLKFSDALMETICRHFQQRHRTGVKIMHRVSDGEKNCSRPLTEVGGDEMAVCAEAAVRAHRHITKAKAAMRKECKASRETLRNLRDQVFEQLELTQGQDQGRPVEVKATNGMVFDLKLRPKRKRNSNNNESQSSGRGSAAEQMAANKGNNVHTNTNTHTLHDLRTSVRTTTLRHLERLGLDDDQEAPQSLLISTLLLEIEKQMAAEPSHKDKNDAENDEHDEQQEYDMGTENDDSNSKSVECARRY